jgi:hypothetical protein
MVNNIASCEDVWREISNYVDGDVEAGLRSSMDEHFKTCARCSSVLAGTRNVVEIYGDERMLEVPAGFSRRLQNRLAKGAVPGSRWSSWSAWLVPVAALGLITGGVLLTNSLSGGRLLKSHHAEPANNIPPDLVVVVSDGAKLFHVPGCPFIHDQNTERTLTAKEAMAEGYVPCTRCLRQYLKTSLTGRPGDRADEDADGDARQEQGEVFSAPGH